MTSEHWRRIDELFQACLELEPTARDAFLENMDADDAVREKVRALLGAASEQWTFIEKPALELAAQMFADVSPQLEPGTRIADYEIVELIGRGGMGEVYLAKDTTLKRQIALKLLPPDYSSDDDRMRRFQQEAQAASALNHPNILTVHQLGNLDRRQFIATEFVAGTTLRDRLREGIDLLDALDIAIQIGNALAAAHKSGIVHRDIKPENIMLRPDGYVKVLDFGLAKLTEQHETAPEGATISGPNVSSSLIMGTVRYMSPEQARGLTVDARSDIFSLGVVLYEMVAGRVPFEGGSNDTVIDSILTVEPRNLAEQLPWVPAKLDAIVSRALNKRTEDRYQQIEELLADLKTIRNEHGAVVSETDERDRARKKPNQARNEKGSNTSPASIVQRFISQIKSRKISTTLVLILVLAGLSLTVYATYRLFRKAAPASSHPGVPLMRTGTWYARASIDSPRYEAEPIVLNGTLYVAGGWNVCTPSRALESYDPASDKWTERAQMHTPRGGHGVGVLGGLLYVVGGRINCGVDTASVEAYEPNTNTWSAKASLPAPTGAHVVAVVDEKLYAIGGESNQSSPSAATTQYDPATNRWSQRAPMPSPRRNAAAAVVNRLIYVLGGVGPNGPAATVEAYNPATNTWTTKAPMPIKRANFGASLIDGVIYAIGGEGNKGRVDAYDPATDTWSAVMPMPSPRSNFHAATLDRSIYIAGGYDGVNYLSNVIVFTPDPIAAENVAPCPVNGSWSTKAPMLTQRGGMATATISGITYAIGGGGAKFYATNEAYDPNSNTWITKAPMPTPRSMLGTNTAAANGILYVIGGNTPGHCTDVNEAYDPKTDRWISKAPMPTPRCHLSIVDLDGLVYAIGGNSNNAFSSVVEVYNPVTNNWTTVAPMPTPRQALAVGSVNGILYAAGGLDLSGPLNVVEAYNPKTNSWTARAPMPTMRSGLAAGVLNNFLVVIGGVDENGRGVSTVEIYDPATDSWRSGAAMPTPRGYLSAVTANNTIYVLGDSSAPVGPSATNEAYTMTCIR